MAAIGGHSGDLVRMTGERESRRARIQHAFLYDSTTDPKDLIQSTVGPLQCEYKEKGVCPIVQMSKTTTLKEAQD